MEKTKIGLPVVLASAMVFLLCLFGGYTVGILVFAYVMLCEKNLTMRVAATTAILLALSYSAVCMVIGFVPNIAQLFNFADNYYFYQIYNSIIKTANIVDSILVLAKNALYLVLAAMCLMGKPLELPFIKKFAAANQETAE